jgi:hypothetical protein
MHARLVSRLTLAAAAAALLLASGCTGSDDRPGTPETPDSPAPRTSSTAAEPSPSPTQTPSNSAEPAPGDDAPLLDRLLPTGLVPGLNATWKWQDGDTGEPTTDPFGLCAQTSPGADLLSIGATEVVARTYFPPDDSDDSAAEQIAEFPDASTANRAWAVLGSWHKRCGETSSADANLKVRPFVPVSVQQGTARWYLLSWQPAGEETGRFEAFGMVLSGNRIAVLRMDNSGQDYNYASGREPMAGMVQAAASWLR